MLELTTYTELELCHRLGGAYSGRCLDLHGHRYQVEITVASATGLNTDGMIVDFKKLKEVVKSVLDDEWDHASCFKYDDPIGISAREAGSRRVHLIDANPTLEWMVDHWAHLLQDQFDKDIPGIALVKLVASETARNTVTWTYDGVLCPRPAAPLTPNENKSIPVNSDKREEYNSRKKDECRARRLRVLASRNAPDTDNPDAVPYLVAYRDCLGMYSEVVYSSLTGKELVDYCQGAVTKVGEPCGTVVVLGISRLPG